uniref:Synaptobrevin, longin-like domain protein n=1 Tax=Tanacetum cinerariifolium TaxID=118510 RepID=A0A699JRP7_TANCI|nr:hypothetical protein [Tanacetum cinerariifolium]
MQALVDKKKVVVTEAAIRDVLQLDDAEGVDYLPNKEIFAELARMGYEKPSTKLTFYKAFFSSQWKFLIHNIFADKRLKKEEMKNSMLKKSLLVMLLKEIMLKNHTYHLLLYLVNHHNHLKISHQHPRRVEHLEYDKVAQALEISKLKRRRIDTSDDTMMDDESNQGRIIDEMDKDDAVALMDDKEEDKKDEEAKVDESAQAKVVTAASEIVSAASIIISAAEPQVPAATITAAHAKDKGKGILVEEPKPLKKKQHVEMDEEYARKLHAKLNKDIDWDVAIDHVKFKAKKDLTKEQMEEEESRVLQRINETPVERAAKRRKLNEEVEDLKIHLEIVPNKDDNVYTEATPLARKVPIVDYEIIEINNKPYYKIIRADRTHQLYISFLTLLKNFDIEDLEAL